MRIGLYLGAAALALAAPASAAWQQASSKHFVIYGDMPIEEMKAYAERLETFDAAARLVRKMPDPKVGDGNRVQVLVVPTMLDVNRTLGDAQAGVGGYYSGQVTGPFIITPRKARQILDYRKLAPETVFFHEYTHHLMLQSTNTPMPMWLTEGFAEFLANPIFNDDGSVSLGTPATHRAGSLIKGRWAPLSDLLGGNQMTLAYNETSMANYVQGWLLNHYLSFEPTRRGQIDAYVGRIAKGENSLAAARAVFGDLGTLDGQLRAYVRQKSLPSLRIESSKLNIPPVTVTSLAPGANEVMPMRIHAKTSYGIVSTGYVYGKVTDIARRYPNDLLVQRTLAEVAFDDKKYVEAEAAANAALKIDPTNTEAMIYRGRAVLARAKKTQDPTLFKQARQYILAANKADPEDPEALYLYYRTYRAANQLAPKGAVDALTYAVALAPRDTTVAGDLVLEHMRQKNWKLAADALRPIAYLPHAGQSTQNKALAVLKLLDANQGPQALAMAEKEFLPKKDENPN